MRGVVNPEVKHDDDMDTTPMEEIVAEGVGMRAAVGKNKQHVKIIPRKVVGATKNIRVLVLACWICLYGQIIKTNLSAFVIVFLRMKESSSMSVL
eukprot:scaffold5398_cov70-Skeletonema_marinoi.AAC.6